MARTAPKHNPLVGWGIVAGITLVGLMAIRFAWPPAGPSQPHYHADFAVYINGVKLDFDGPAYYEEVAACSESERNVPKSRVHLHAPSPGVTHVHDYAVTWAHFLANLGITFADNYLATSANAYIPGSGKQLRFVLNGQLVSYPSSKVIGNEDILLIDYGNDQIEEIWGRYNQIKAGAPLANQVNDPAGCFGVDGPPSTASRLWRALQVWR